MRACINLSTILNFMDFGESKENKNMCCRVESLKSCLKPLRMPMSAVGMGSATRSGAARLLDLARLPRGFFQA